MASIQISQIQKLLVEQGQRDAEPNGAEGYFLEIRFDNPERSSGPVGLESYDKVLTADSAYGTVTIVFDHLGQLKSIDLS